ncbi:hypothetical protein R9C00_04520 [Flammeovirgaceae bacterium SG7u.111]|nr:hypothetical protein [Flammeovirgaceae bacterium SG7u.132]WPO36711.1 hypothetical protein R9C00_04520 [Flammeovirgaceae bacterium SG7u.111]
MRKFSIVKFLIFSVLIVSLASCGESDVEQEGDIASTNSQVTSDEVFAEAVFDGVDFSIESAQAGQREAADPCLDYSLSGSEGVLDLTLDFGSEPCEGADGVTRQGKILVTITGGEKLEAANSKTVITFDNFFVDGHKVEGIRTIENLGFEEGTLVLKQKITMTDGKITLSDGRTITRNATWDKTWDILNGIHNLEGSASGKTRQDITYQSEVTETIVRKRECFLEGIYYPVQGKKTIAASNGTATVVRVVDFGDGTCDKKVVVTINGEDTELEL